MFLYPKEYDVIVVGAGHAGIEAALAAARLGAETLMLVINADTIGQMSCNPAIGGLAKGHLVREIDALGGEMAKATDMTGLQFRMLNAKKGPSVRAPRAQCDKKAYQFRMKWVCERQARLDIKQAQVIAILHEDRNVVGVQTGLGTQFQGRSVIVTTGTFLQGLMHIGGEKQSGGRAGEAAAHSLSKSLREVGLELGRLKTGTPPRILRRSIDFSRTEEQKGDEPIPFFSFWKDDLFHVEQYRNEQISDDLHPPGSIVQQIGGQLSCYITHTTRETADQIRENLHKSPLYSGAIEGVGPRYCPSIEDKIIKFPEKPQHQIFLEPEGIATDEFYLNGFSTSLPYDVQVGLVRTIVGCEQAEIYRPAYAVEYDFVLPTQLNPSLEAKVCRNLFLAGQINGTSGYEEAGAQGLVAGINAVRSIRGLPPIVLRRDEAYIGVLIDDLVTKGTTEPYRMFTSRAEYRLLLRQDNADLRLSTIGYDVGLLPRRNFEQVEKKRRLVKLELERLAKTWIGSTSLLQILRRPGVTYSELAEKNETLSTDVCEQVEFDAKYAGYVERQQVDVAKLRAMEAKRIPDWLDYNDVPSLRKEARQKLQKIRPQTLGQAGRISGVSPADITLVMVWMKRGASADLVRESKVSSENII